VATVSTEGEENKIVCTLCICMCMCMYVWICIQRTHVHTHIHTHIHTHTQPPQPPSLSSPHPNTHIPGVSSSGAAASLASYALSTCVCIYRRGGSTLIVRAPALAKTRTNSPCVYTPVYILTYIYVYVSVVYY
jgi:hypothetical protein